MGNTIRKVAALGAGALMTGATLGFGALAAGDLGSLPSPFVVDQAFVSTAIVIGESGSLDEAARGEINSYLSSLATATSGGGQTVSEGVEEEIPITKGLGDLNVGFDRSIEDDDVEHLLDTEVSFQSSDYSVREVVLLNATHPSIETSLTSGEDKYRTDVFMEVQQRDKIKYYYAFDESINVSKATSTDPLKIKFLGRSLKITSTNLAGTEFTARVGEEHFLKVGGSVVVDGISITLENVGSDDDVVVNVDGTIEQISSGSSRTVGALEILNDEAFYTENFNERSATLVIGKDAQETIKDEEQYFGGNDVCDDNNADDPDCWVWDVAGLSSNSATSNLTDAADTCSGVCIGLENDFVINDDADNPKGVGECVNLPNNYVSVCFDGLSVADDDYATYTFEYESSVDFSQVGGGFATQSSEKSLFVWTAEDEGLQVESDTFANISSDQKTKKIWMSVNNANRSQMDVFWLDKNDNKKKYAGNTTIGMSATGSEGEATPYFRILHGDTKDTNIEVVPRNGLGLFGNASSGINLTLNVTGDNSNELAEGEDHVTMQWGFTSGEFTSLGFTANSEEASELAWNGTNIGTKDEDHRTKYGIIIEDPKGKSSSDTVVLRIPSDQLQAKIKIGGSVTSSGTGTGGAAALMTSSDSRLGTPSDWNYITVGGPCVNSLTASFLGVPSSSCGTSSGFNAGEGYVELKDNGGKMAMMVAGWERDDTLRAAKVVANPGSFGLSGKSAVTVKGTSTQVGDITVA